MLVTAGIRIYLNNGLTEPSIGCENGVITLTEATHAVGTNHIDDHLLANWDSGCSTIIDVRTHPRPQTFSGGTITIDNNRDYYGKLVMYGAEIEGKKIERVHYRSGDVQVISTHYIKQVKHETSKIELSLSGLNEVQEVTISQPISESAYYPVIFGANDYGIHYLDSEYEEPVEEGVNFKFAVVSVTKLDNETSEAQLLLTPIDQSVTPANFNVSYSDDIYMKVISGNGEGDIFKLGKTTIGFTEYSLVTQLSTYTGVIAVTEDASYWDVNNDSRYIGVGEVTPVLDDTTTIVEVFRLAKSYYSDNNSTFSTGEKTYYDTDKKELAQWAYTKTGNKITESNLNVVDGVVNGLPWGSFDSVEYNTDIDITSFIGATMVYASNGVWVSFADNPAQYVISEESGTLNNIIDVTRNNNYSVRYFRASRTLEPVRTAFSVKLYGTLADVKSLLSECQTVILASDAESVSVRSNLILAPFWEEDNGYFPISDPQEFLLIEKPYTTVLANRTQFDFNNFTDDIEGAFSNSEHIDNSPAGIVTGRKVRGNDNFTIDASTEPLKTKQPTGYLLIFYTASTYSFDAGESITHDYTVKMLGYYKEETTNSETDVILSPVNGRPYTTFSAAIAHIIKLRNWNVSGVSQPTAGWGLEEAVVSVTDNVSDTTPVRTQIKNASDMVTTSIEQRLMWESWNMIHFNKDDTPIIDDVVSKLGAESATHSFTEPDDCEQVSIDIFDEQDIFNIFNVQYNYDATNDTYNGTISIENAGKDLYNTSYVSGVTDATTAEQLWDDCHTLYGVTGAEKILPESRSKLNWVYTEEDAIAYIQNCLKFYGVKRITGSSYGAYYTTRRVTMEHDIRDYYAVNIGDSIEYTIPNITSGLPFSGVVIGMSYSPDSKRCTITSILRAQVESRSIIETGSADKSIIEQGNSINTIIEVGA